RATAPAAGADAAAVTGHAMRARTIDTTASLAFLVLAFFCLFISVGHLIVLVVLLAGWLAAVRLSTFRNPQPSRVTNRRGALIGITAVVLGPLLLPGMLGLPLDVTDAMGEMFMIIALFLVPSIIVELIRHAHIADL